MAELQEVDPVPYEAIAWVHVVGWVTRPCAKDYPTAASQVQVRRQIAARRQRQQLADAGYPRKTGVGEPNHWRSGDSDVPEVRVLLESRAETVLSISLNKMRQPPSQRRSLPASPNPAHSAQPANLPQVSRRSFRPFHEAHRLGVKVFTKSGFPEFSWILRACEPIKIKVIQV